MGRVLMSRRVSMLIAPGTSTRAAVTLTGSGSATNCYALINGTTYSSAASGIEVKAGDVITFCVYGLSATYYGAVTINGSQVLYVTGSMTDTYNWTVPAGITDISIAFSYAAAALNRNGKITVTTV